MTKGADVESTEFNATHQARVFMIATGQPAADLAAAAEAGEKTWTTAEMQEEFEVLGFQAPFVTVRRKSDGVLGSLEFVANPRKYFGWQEHQS